MGEFERGNKATRFKTILPPGEPAYDKYIIFLKEEKLMKKSLVLAMAIAMGISASAFAANPFSDVPAGHWAYGSIAKLAAAGVVDGYADGTYRGDRLMTRYEMAQIVARAMAKGANVDRLASEFADELDSLGVRVAKLEKKSDNVRVTGYARYSYLDHTQKNKGAEDTRIDDDYAAKLRSRIWFTGTVNDNWKYVGMLENNQNFSNNVGDETTNFQRAYLAGRLGGAQVTAGRFNNTIVDGNLYDHRMDAVKVEYGKKIKVGAYYGKPTNEDSAFDYNKVWGANAEATLGGFDLTAGYDKFTNSDVKKLDDNGVWNVGAKYDFGKASLGAIYMKSGLDAADNNTNKGIVVTGTVMGADAAKPGTWGLWGKFYDQGYGTVLAHTMNGIYSDNGFKGWGAGVDYTLAKNMVGSFEYYDLDQKGADSADKTLWSQLIVTF